MLGVSESSVTAHIPNFKNAFKILDTRWAMQYKDVVKLIEEYKQKYKLPETELDNKAG